MNTIAPPKTRLPETIAERVELALGTCLAPQKERILIYLVVHPKTYTHDLARNCAVGYPPNRIMELNREILPHYGLQIECVAPPKGLTNRFGRRTYVHWWQLVKLPERVAA